MTATQTKTSLLLESASLAAQQVRLDSSAKLLTSHRLLKDLRPSELAKVVSAGRWVTFREGEVVSEQGNSVNAVMFVAQGRAKAEVAAPARAAYKAVINFLGQGDDIGLLSLLDRAPHSATVTSLDELKVLEVPVAAVEECLDNHPEWYRQLAEIAVSRLRTSGLWLEALI